MLKIILIALAFVMLGSLSASTASARHIVRSTVSSGRTDERDWFRRKDELGPDEQNEHQGANEIDGGFHKSKFELQIEWSSDRMLRLSLTKACARSCASHRDDLGRSGPVCIPGSGSSWNGSPLPPPGCVMENLWLNSKSPLSSCVLMLVGTLQEAASSPQWVELRPHYSMDRRRQQA